MEQETKKIFRYKGKTIEELKNLDTREFARLIRAKERRFVLRNSQKIDEFINRAVKKINKNKSIKTHRRDLIFVPKMVGWKVHIYNGQKFIPVQVTGETLGHRFGELSPSRQRITHGKAGVGATKGSKHKSKK